VKYLVVSAILGLGFLLVYSRLRPYIQFVRKIVSLVNASGDALPRQPSPQTRQVENRLTQCAACHTWIPADRAIHPGGGLTAYCSTACLEKSAGEKKQKLAG